MKWEIGDSLRIKDASQILGNDLRNGEIYEVTEVSIVGSPVFIVNGRRFRLHEFELGAVERLSDADVYQYEMSNAELGEPSADCDVTLSEIYEELLDMKAMIGRLIRNGGDEE